MRRAIIIILIVLGCLFYSDAFSPSRASPRYQSRGVAGPLFAAPIYSKDAKGNTIVTLPVPLAKGVKDVDAQFRPLFANSEFFMVTYKVPFSLNIERPPKNFPCPVVTKEGPLGEKTGDVLRACSCFSQGFQAAGLTSDIASFAGNIKTRPALFDTTGAQWDAVVSALVSNTEERTDSVTLVFERDTGAE